MTRADHRNDEARQLAAMQARYGDRIREVAAALPPLDEAQKRLLTVVLRDVVSRQQHGGDAA